jgi:hypothetical protein
VTWRIDKGSGAILLGRLPFADGSAKYADILVRRQKMRGDATQRAANGAAMHDGHG